MAKLKQDRLPQAGTRTSFLSPRTDGVVLPILHLNGYKIANPAVLARLSKSELSELLHGLGWQPYFVEGDDPAYMHQLMANTLDQVMLRIKEIQQQAKNEEHVARPFWPMIVLRSPKGWTGPKVVDGVPIEGTFRSHQVPLAELATRPDHLRLLEEWMRSYHPEELFDERGALSPQLAELAPKGERRMGANPCANGGLLLKELSMPDFRNYAVTVDKPGRSRPRQHASWAISCAM